MMERVQAKGGGRNGRREEEKGPNKERGGAREGKRGEAGMGTRLWNGTKTRVSTGTGTGSGMRDEAGTGGGGATAWLFICFRFCFPLRVKGQ